MSDGENLKESNRDSVKFIPQFLLWVWAVLYATIMLRFSPNVWKLELNDGFLLEWVSFIVFASVLCGLTWWLIYFLRFGLQYFVP